MKKMPCLFRRDFSDKRHPVLLNEVTSGCEWALTGGGTPSRKRDGTAVAVINGVLYKRYDAKKKPDGEYRLPTTGAIPCDNPDPITGHWPHWVIVVAGEPADKHHLLAWIAVGSQMEDSTYELCGPPIGSNHEGLDRLTFFRHGAEMLDNVPRTFDGLREYLTANLIEGIVFKHEDGRMCKIRRDDYGLAWPFSVGIVLTHERSRR
jgi:hypothetical protein